MTAAPSHVVILGDPADPTIAPVCWWMRNFGVPHSVISTREFPKQALSSVYVNDHSGSVDVAHTSLPDQHYAANCVGVWNRRRPMPAPRMGTHRDDLSIVKQQSVLFLANLLNNIAHDAFWVNSLESQRRADQKLTVLSLAKTCGFNVPETLASNDPVRIREFAARHQWRVIAKNFIQAGWQTNAGDVVVLRTSAISRDNLTDDEALAKCPMVYQPLIEKTGELRITVIGEQVFPFAVITSDSATVDWRTDEPAGKVRFAYTSIPQSLERMCVALCRRLGIVFACIDVLTVSGGGFVFLEVNESGQFLWLEEANPDVPLLDAFCRLLTSRVKTLNGPPTPLRLESYRSSQEWKDLLAQLRAGVARQGLDALVQEQ